MREKLLEEIYMALVSEGIEINAMKAKLIIILNNYEIQQRCTEVRVVNEDDISKYIRLFLISKRVSGRTERTIDCYKNDLRRFFREVQKSPLEVTSDDIKLYLATKEVRDGVGKVYLQHMLRAISSFYQWMSKEEYVLKNPMNKVEAIKTPKVKKNAFTETQIEQLRLTMNDDLRLICIFEMLLSTWCRVSEIAQIKISEISEDRETVLVHGKGAKDRICYINARAKIYLEKYLQERNDENPYLFPNCRIGVGNPGQVFSAECKKTKYEQKDWWKTKDLIGTGHIDKGSIESMLRKLGRKAKVENVHPHRFRRTGATFALRKGMPINQVSKLLGHENIATTQIYLDISELELEQAHRKFV